MEIKWLQYWGHYWYHLHLWYGRRHLWLVEKEHNLAFEASYLTSKTN